MLKEFAHWVIKRDSKKNPFHKEACVTAIQAILKEHGLGNNNSKRRDAAEAIHKAILG